MPFVYVPYFAESGADATPFQTLTRITQLDIRVIEASDSKLIILCPLLQAIPTLSHAKTPIQRTNSGKGVPCR